MADQTQASNPSAEPQTPVSQAPTAPDISAPAPGGFVPGQDTPEPAAAPSETTPSAPSQAAAGSSQAPVSQDEGAGVRSVSEDEYQRMLQGSRAFEMIESDPAIASQVRSYFEHKRSSNPAMTTANSSPGGAGQQVEEAQASHDANGNPIMSEINALKQQNQQLAQTFGQTLAQMQVQMFRQQHPDMDQYVPKMQQYVTKHNMPLEEAYRIAKLESGQQSTPPAAQARPAAPVTSHQGSLPTAEGRGAGGSPSDEGDYLQAARAQIDDPKKPRMGIDEAFDLALAAATKQHGQ